MKGSDVKIAPRLVNSHEHQPSVWAGVLVGVGVGVGGWVWVWVLVGGFVRAHACVRVCVLVSS